MPIKKIIDEKGNDLLMKINAEVEDKIPCSFCKAKNVKNEYYILNINRDGCGYSAYCCASCYPDIIKVFSEMMAR